MSTKTENMLELPIYANKPQRRIPGTNFVAVTMYRSNDNSVREFTIFTADGKAILGTAHYHPKRSYFPAGYTMTSVRRVGDEQWSNLASFATEMAKRLEVEA